MSTTVKTNDDRRLTIYETVQRIVGPIQPLGDSTLDPLRLANLKELTWLATQIINEVHFIAQRCANSHQDSVQRAGKHAHSFMVELGELAYTEQAEAPSESTQQK